MLWCVLILIVKTYIVVLNYISCMTLFWQLLMHVVKFFVNMSTRCITLNLARIILWLSNMLQLEKLLNSGKNQEGLDRAHWLNIKNFPMQDLNMLIDLLKDRRTQWELIHLPGSSRIIIIMTSGKRSEFWIIVKTSLPSNIKGACGPD